MSNCEIGKMMSIVDKYELMMQFRNSSKRKDNNLS